MNLQDLLDEYVHVDFHDDFVEFITTGKASSEVFENYLDTDRECQKALDIVFKAQASQFDEWVRSVHENL